MVKPKNKIVKKTFSVLSVVILSLLAVYYMVVGNSVFATDIYTSAIPTQTNSKRSSTDIKDGLSDLIFNFIDNIKFTVSNRASKTVATFDYNTTSSNGLASVDQFSDILKHPDRYYINYLASKNIVSTNQDKFNPDNFVRLNEIAKMFVNSYRLKVGYKIDSSVGLSEKNYFNALMPKYYNTAYEIGLFKNVQNLEDFERFISYQDLDQMLNNLKRQYPNLINLDSVDFIKSGINPKRGEIARITFQSFVMNETDSDSLFYNDIYYHKNAQAIQTLSELDITNTQNTRFYPDNNITRGDFIAILVKSYLKQNNLELNISNIEFNIKDLDYNSVYAPFVIYAQEQGIIDYLFETKRSEKYINITKLLSKHEAYHIISKVSGEQINYDILKADKEKITRGEVAQIIVDHFDFDTKNISSSANSHIGRFLKNIKSITESPKIAWLIS